MVRWAYGEAVCCFCHESLLFHADGDDTDYEDPTDDPAASAYNPGDGDGSPLDMDVTLHHLNGDHHDNTRANHAWAHRRCHKSHHLREQHAARRAAKRKK
jgi:hypothetical protein